MPYFRFLAGAGGVIVALMFAANAYLSGPDATPVEKSSSSHTGFDPSTIRITSTRKGPERVVIDTSLPTIVPPAPTVNLATVTPPRPAREAFAQANAEQAPAAKPVKEAKAQPHKPAHRRVARRYYYEQQPVYQQRQVAGDMFSFWFR